MPKSQKQFLTDLQSFITNHPHYKANEGIFDLMPREDQITAKIHDVDGDYEELHITIDLIA